MPARAASWWARSLSMHKALDNVPQPMTGTPGQFKESLYRTVLAVLAVEDWEYRVKEETAAGAVQQ